MAVESDRGGQVSLKMIMLHTVEKKLKIRLGQSTCLIGAYRHICLSKNQEMLTQASALIIGAGFILFHAYIIGYFYGHHISFLGCFMTPTI